MSRKCLRIEISECNWREDLKFQMRTGDLDGATTSSNISANEVIEMIKLEMGLNWKELGKTNKEFEK